MGTIQIPSVLELHNNYNKALARIEELEQQLVVEREACTGVCSRYFDLYTQAAAAYQAKRDTP